MKSSTRPSSGFLRFVGPAGFAATILVWTFGATAAHEPSGDTADTERAAAFRVVSQEPPSLPPGEQAPPAAAPAGEAPAEESPPELRELEQLLQQPVVSVTGVPIVTSASRRAEKSTAAPATVIVIDRQDIVLRGYSQLSEVLRDLPGMETIEYFFSEFGTQVPVRGISGNNKILVLVNGMRVNPPGGENFPFRNDFSVRHAERIEVVYGAGSTLYGQDVISAVINVVTIDPAGGGTPNLGELDDPLSFNNPDAPKSAGGTSFEAGAEAGVFFEREAWAWYGGELGCCRDIKVSGYVQYHDSELMQFDREFPSYWQDFRDIAATKTNANGGGIDPSRSDFGLNLFGRVEWRDWSFQVWHRQSQRNSAEGYTDVLGFLPEAKWGDSSLAMEGKNTRQLTDNVTLESAVTYDAYEINPSSRYIFPDGSDSTKWFLDDFKYGRGWRVGLEETVRADLTDNFSLLGGGLAWYSDIIPKATFPGGFDPNLDTVGQAGSFFYSDTVGGTLQSIPRVSEILFWTYAAYLEGQWQVFDDLRLIAGVRVTKDDHFDEIPITPRASVVYDVTDRLTAKYMYTEAFVAPAPYFANSVYDRGDILAQANPGVSAETAKTHEVNLTYNRENVSLGFSAYYGLQGNLIIISDRNLPQNLVDPQVFLNGDATQERRLVQTSSGGTSERFGMDLYGKVTLGSFRTWFSYSYVDLTENNAGMITGLPGISRHNGRLGTTWRATPKLFITPSLVIRSTPEGVTSPGRLGSELDTPYEINLYALYKRNEHLDLFLDLRNITDNHYALTSFAGDAYPQETFCGMAGLRLTY